jgi:hypothetical protein
MSFQTAGLPNNDALVDKQGRATQVLMDWATSLAQDVDSSPSRLVRTQLAAQSASVGSTSLSTGALAAGLYRVSYFARIATPASSSSSLIVSVGATDAGVPYTLSGAAMTGNTTDTAQGGVFLLRVDASTPLVFSTTYASSGGTAMNYDLDVVAEQVDA